MKPLITIIALFLLAATSRAELTIVSTGYRDADSFKRVGEYLTGKPSDGRYAVFRSDPASRDGFYVSLLAADRAQLANVSKIRVQFVPKGTQEIETFEAPVTSLKKKRILFGLTGAAWADSANHPVAWKIELLDSDETSLDSAQSFLWSN